MFRPNVKLVLEPGAGARIVDEQSQRTLTLTPTEGRILALVGPGTTAESLTSAAKGAGIDIETKQIEALLSRLAANELIDFKPAAAGTTQATLLPDDIVPAFRTDLRVAPAPKPGLMLVTDKKRDRSFTLYDFEVHIARLLDGHHTVAQVIERSAKIGMPVTPESLGKFISQMKAYGFIQEGVLAPRASPEAASDMWPARSQWSAEIRELYQSALRQFRAGRPGHALEYLTALLEVRPDTPEAIELKKRVEEHMSSGPPMELSFEDLHGVDDPMPALVAAAEPLLGGSTPIQKTIETPAFAPPVVATDGIPAKSPMSKTVVSPRLTVPPPSAPPPPPPAPLAPPAPAPPPPEPPKPTSLLEPEPLQISVSAPRRSAPIFPPRASAPLPAPRPSTPRFDEPQKPASLVPEAPKSEEVEKPRPSAPIFAKPPPPSVEVEKPRPSAPIFAKPPPPSPAPEPPAPLVPKPSPPSAAPEAPAPIFTKVEPTNPAMTPPKSEPVEKPRPSAPIFAKPRPSPAEPPPKPKTEDTVIAKIEEPPKARPSAPVLFPQTPTEEVPPPTPSVPVLFPKGEEPAEPRSSAPVLAPKTELEVPKPRPSAPVLTPKLEEPPPPEPSATVSDELPPLESERTHVGDSPLESRGTELMPEERTLVGAPPERPAVTEPEVPKPSAPRRSRPSVPATTEESVPAPRPSRPKPDGAVPDAPVRVRRSQPQVPKATEPPPKRTALYAGIGAAVALAALAFPIPATQRIDVELVATPMAAPKFPAGAFGELKVKSGTRVEEGTVIATVDVTKQKAEKEELAKTIARLEQAAQKALAKANPAFIAKAKAAVAKAKTELAKAKAGVAKAKDRAKAELDVGRKEAALERAERLVVAADGTEKAKTLKVEATALKERSAKLQQQIDRAVVTAPATGVFELDALPPAGANFDEGTEFGRIVAPQLLVQGAPDDVKDPVLISGESRIALFALDRRAEGLTVPFERGLKPGPAVLEVSRGYRPWPMVVLSR